MTVLVAAKRTTFDHEIAERSYDAIREQYPDEDLQAICEGHETHYNTLHRFEEQLDDHDVAYDTVYTDSVTEADVAAADAVVAIGGDGNVLDAAKYVQDATPLLPIRSDGKSRGGLTTYGYDELDEAADALLEGDTEEWTRIAGHHDGATDIALNEIFLGAQDSRDAARYVIEHCQDGEEQVEQQQSDALIVSTGAGSTGWYSNIDESLEPFPNDAQEFRYVADNPMDSPDEPYTLRNGTVKPGDTFTVRSLMNGDKDGIIGYDGDKSRDYPFPRGTTIEITVADTPLSVIT